VVDARAPLRLRRALRSRGGILLAAALPAAKGVAAAVERGIAAAQPTLPAYKARLRAVLHVLNTAGAERGSLLQRLGDGSVAPLSVGAMQTHQLPGEAARARAQELRENGTLSARARLREAAPDGMHQCPKCRSHKTTHTQAQTRSADESMTVFVCCFVCDHRFRYS
jgi:DNA-directed RNA polymerase subunit M/transcription elongation factor TFIIS